MRRSVPFNPDEVIRVLFLTEDLGDGGTAKHVGEMAPRLQAHGFRTTVWSRGESGRYWRELKAAMVPVLIRKRMIGRLSIAMAFQQYDLVHSFLYGPHLADAVICAGLRVPYVKSTRNSGHWNTSTARIKWQVLARSRVISHHVANSSGAREYLIEREGIDPSKVFVIPNGIRDDQGEGPFLTRGDIGLRESDFVMVSVAWLKPHKHIEFLVGSLPLILRQCPSVKLLIVGSGRMEAELRRLASEVGVGAACVFAGRQQAPHSFMRVSDVLVSASPREGMSNALLEAQMMALPAVVTEQAGGNKDVIEGGVNGFLYPFLNAERFSECVTLLASDAERRSAMARAARRVYEQAFTLDVQVQRYVSYYRRVLQGGFGEGR